MRRLGLLVAVACVASGAPAAQAAPGSCAWKVELAGDQVNAMFPDEAARYWTALVPIPPGGHIRISGRYPHARYFSFGTYGERFNALDAIADVEIGPDAGAANPFLAGADRTAAARGYRVKVVAGGLRPGERRPRNTLYAGGERAAGIALRIYEPDRGRDSTGDAGLPEVAIVDSGGARTVVPPCPDRSAPDLGVRQTLAAAGPAAALPRGGVLGRAEPRWRKYTNNPSLVAGVLLDGEASGGTGADPATSTLSARLPPGGFGENVHNRYVYATASREFGQVLLLRGRAPTTPRTHDGQPVMGTGQLRFWSICGYGQTTSFYACLNDDGIPVDRAGRYTIAISTAAARPSNAVASCGIAWMPAGPSAQTILLMRHMLPAPGFAHAIQRVEAGREAEQLGPYYPRGTYYADRAAVERLGCG